MTTTSDPFRAALIEGWPIMLSSLIVGTAFGVVARQAGLEVAQVAAMSAFVFAGLAQFVSIQLIVSGATPALVVLTILFVNLRHLLMGAALRPFVVMRPLPLRLWSAYVLVDESFALGIGWWRRGRGELAYYLTIGSALWVAWNSGSLAGAIFGAAIADPRRLGVDFAITATFVAILVMSARHRADWVVAAIAFTAAGAIQLAGATTLAIVVAAALAPLAVFASPGAPVSSTTQAAAGDGAP